MINIIVVTKGRLSNTPHNTTADVAYTMFNSASITGSIIANTWINITWFPTLSNVFLSSIPVFIEKILYISQPIHD